MNKCIHSIISTACILYTSVSFADNRDHQREVFLKAYDELRAGKIDNYTNNRHKLNNYILQPYLDYLYLVNKLDDIKGKDLRSFVNNHKDWPFTWHLKSSYIETQAKSGNWKNVEYIFEPSSNTKINCYGLTAKYINQSKNWIKESLDIWLNGNSQPNECDPIFKALEDEGHLTSSTIWKRIQLAFENDNLSLVNYLSKKLPDNERELVKFWSKAHMNPSLIYDFNFSEIKHPATIEIVVHAIGKLAKKDTREAVSAWRQISSKYSFNHRHWSTVVRAIAVELAIDNHEQSADWLDKIPRKYITSKVAQLKLQIALRNYNWDAIIEMIDEMPEEDQNDEKWQYWHSIALDQTGHRNESQKILLSLSHNRSYYGFMASKRVLRPYALKNQTMDIPVDKFAEVHKNIHLRRALEWRALDKEHNANQEWYKFLRNAEEVERHAGAAIVAKEGAANWAIIALANAKNKNNLDLRFPRHYSSEIHKNASHNNIDPAWIFAVTRQESAFKTKARSSAGAMGLMQLIPSTAKMVAKESKTPYRNKNDLFDANTNISLGSKYLKMLLEDYNENHILATASYNAGPTRVRRWLPDHNMRADVWIETIPFSETRNYVQNVIAYTIIYQQLLGKEESMRNNLSYIPSKSIIIAEYK